MTTRGFSKDNAQTTVSNGGSAISSGATSVPVAAATNFPSSGVYCVKTPSGEVMQITGGQGTTTWTVVRGVGGTTAASIPDGATLKEVLSSEDMKLMAQLSDSRFTDSRTPTAHAASHASGGSDAITVADALITAVSASKLTGSHTLPDGTLSTNVPLLNAANVYTAKQEVSAFRITPGGTTGAPTSGAHVVGEIYIDSAGTSYVCTVAGTPGTWSSGSGGSSTLAADTDVSISSPATGDLLRYNGTAWANKALLTLSRVNASADVTLTSSFADVLTVTPAAGTYLITAVVQAYAGTTLSSLAFQLLGASGVVLGSSGIKKFSSDMSTPCVIVASAVLGGADVVRLQGIVNLGSGLALQHDASSSSTGVATYIQLLKVA